MTFNNKISICLAMLLISSGVFGQKGVATIKGVINSDQKQLPLSYDSEEAMLGSSKNVEIKADNDGKFSVKVQLDKPAYYKIIRNTLYLSPGDNLEVIINEDSGTSSFSGKGAEANNYLKKRLYPKAGSFMDAGRNAFSTLDSLTAYVKLESGKRFAELEQLKNVSKIFKETEAARIKADIINTYLSYPNYHRSFVKISNYEEYLKAVSKLLAPVMPEIKQLYREINDDRFLGAEVVRIVFAKAFKSPELKNEIVFSTRIRELFETLEKSSVLSINPTKENIDGIKKYISTMKFNDLKQELQNKIQAIGHLTKGSLAFDIELQDVDGKQSKLSDYKGKYIYIDLWATWCGPCKAEAPYFEKLSKEFGSENIHFISISVDTSKSAWTNYVKDNKKEGLQFLSNDKKIRNNWMLNGIPRFILIDKDFKIIDAFAKRPSDPQLKVILKNVLK